MLSLEELKKFDLQAELEKERKAAKKNTKQGPKLPSGRLEVKKALPRASEVQPPVRAGLPSTNLFAGMAEYPKAGILPTAAEAAKKKVSINLDTAPMKVHTTANPTILPKVDMTKSTAKDEKTRLYQTNDSLLSNDEIFRKYQYVLNDKEMDYATMRQAAKKGMAMAGKMVQRSPDMDTAKRAAQMQVDLQGKLKSAALTAGLLESMGGTIRDLTVRGVNKASPETGKAMQAQSEALKAQFQQAQANHPDYYTGGQVSGELAKMAALYSTVGKAAEETALKAAGALGARMSAATASDFAQKAYALAKYNPKIAAAAKFGTRMLGQQAADTAVLAPLVAADGIAEGKSRDEILKELAKQEAIAAGFNVGMGAIPAIARGVKAAAGNASTKAAQRAIPRQIEASMRGEMPSNQYIKLGKTPEILRKYGMIKGDMVMPQSVVPKAAYPAEYRQALAKGAGISESSIRNIQGHNLGFEAIRQLPEKMKNPVAILKSDTKDGSVVVLTDMVDAYKQPVIVPIRINKDGTTDLGTVIPSIYGKKDFQKFIGQQKEKGNVLYLDTKRNLQQLPNSGLQLPESFNADADPMLRIAQRSGKVNREELQNITRGSRHAEAERAIAEKVERERTLKRANNMQEILHETVLPEGEHRLLLPRPGEVSNFTAGEGGIVQGNFRNFDERPYPPIHASDRGVNPEVLPYMPKGEKGYYADGIDSLSQQYHVYNGRQALVDQRAVQKAEAKAERAAQAEARTAAKAQKEAAKAQREADTAALQPKDIQELHNLKYRQEQAVKEARKGVKLSEDDEDLLKRMHAGRIGEEKARTLAEGNADDLIAVFRAEKPLRETEKILKDYKKYTKQRHYDTVQEAVGEIHLRDGKKEGWHDKETPFFYARETQERNLYDIAPNRETADRIREKILDPIHENERDRVLFSNGLKERIRQVRVSTKKNIRFTSRNGAEKMSESGLVQFLGEKRYQLQRLREEAVKRPLSAAGKEEMELLRQEVEAATAAVTPEQLARINEGITEYQKIYEEIHPLINEALIRNGYDPIGYTPGYFPHMNFDEPEGILEKTFHKLGFDFASKELPMDLAGRTETFRPGKKWSGNLEKRKGTKTDYDAARAFDLYIDNISDVIYHTDDIQRLRAYEDYFRYNLSEKGIQEKIKAIRNDASLSDFEREGRIAELYEENAKNHKLQNYVSNIRIYTDTELAGKKHISDRGAEQSYFGRKFYKRINTLGSRVSANMVAGNIASAITNIIPITQAAGSIGVKNGVRGLQSAMEAFAEGAGKDALTRKSAFLTTRRGLDMLYETGLQKVSKKAGALMEIMDSFSTQFVWRGRYFDNVAKGLDEETAIKEADRFCRGLFAGRSKGSMPTMFMSKHPLTKALSAFQLEVNNQISFFLKDVPRNAQGSARKMAKAYCGAIIMGHIYNDFYEKLTGRRSALDPLDYANKFIGDMTGTQGRNVIDIVKDAADGEGLRLTEKTAKRVQAEKEGEDFKPIPSDAIGNLTKNIGGQVPFVGGLLFDGGRVPIQSAFINPKEVLGTVADASNGTITKEQRNEILRRQFGGALAYAALPFGGAQIKKSIGGLETMAKGGSYKQRKEGASLQFAVDQENPLNWIQAGAFGKWALPEGQKYFDDGKALDPKRTKTYEALVKGGVKNTSAYQIISNIQSKKKGGEKRAAIRWTALPKEQQAILYYDLAAGDEDKALMDYFNMRAKSGKGKAEDIGEVYDCLSRMAEHGNSVLPKRNIIREINLSDEDKKHIYLTRVSNSVAKESKCISKLEKHGIRINAYLSIKNKYGTLNSQKGIDQTAEFNRWLREQGFSWEQQKAIKEEFMFWGMYPKK